jgi:hypothetical protein
MSNLTEHENCYDAATKAPKPARYVPPFPERTAYHWIRRFRGGPAIPLWWCAEWHKNGKEGWGKWAQADREDQWEYCGPCPSPDDKQPSRKVPNVNTSVMNTPGDMAAFGANESACYRWPMDTAEHRAMRAAYCDGAAWAATEIERLRAAVEDAIDTLEAMGLHVDNPLYDRLVAAIAPASGESASAPTEEPK